jgi:hypothetical protein
MCPHRDWFSSFEPLSNGGSVLDYDDSPCKIEGISSVKIKMFDGMIRTLTDVRYIPGMKRNLVSLSFFDGKGYHYSGGDSCLKIIKGSLVVMKADLRKSSGLYYLRGSTISGSAAPVIPRDVSDCDASNLWHMRLGHMSEKSLAELSKRGLLEGYSENLKFCEHCIFGKHKRVKFNTSTHTTEKILDYVHSDLWGPSRKPSFGGSRYMMTIIDDYSRKVWPYFLKHKSETFSAFKEWKTRVENQKGKKIKKLRTDNGMEFCSREFKSYCKSQGIVRYYTVPGTPQQNGVSERMNRTIISKVRCMLSNVGLNRHFWAEAVSTACYLINRSPSTAIYKKTPIEVWFGSPDDYSSLRVFGCPAYVHVDNGKLEPRTVKYIFVGYKSGVKGFKLWNPETKKMLVSRNVVFNEAAMLRGNDVPVDQSTDAEDSGQKSNFEVEHSVKFSDSHAPETQVMTPVPEVSAVPQLSQPAVPQVAKDLPHETQVGDSGGNTPVAVNSPQHSIGVDRPRREPKPGG